MCIEHSPRAHPSSRGGQLWYQAELWQNHKFKPHLHNHNNKSNDFCFWHCCFQAFSMWSWLFSSWFEVRNWCAWKTQQQLTRLSCQCSDRATPAATKSALHLSFLCSLNRKQASTVQINIYNPHVGKKYYFFYLSPSSTLFWFLREQNLICNIKETEKRTFAASAISLFLINRCPVFEKKKGWSGSGGRGG